MDDEVPNEPLFRVNKRRKVLRKRAGSDASDNVAPAVTEDSEASITKHSSDSEKGREAGVVRSQKKGGVRKHGIGFTSGDGTRIADAQNEGLAMVLANEDGGQKVVQIERFVKPTGRVAVADSQHMTAYVDSKLAEMRSPAATPVNGTSTLDTHNSRGAREGLETGAQGVHHDSQAPSAVANAPPDRRTLQQAQSRSTRVYQRPTKRRQPPQRGQDDVARDSLIDQIMRESEVPLYDRSVSHTQRAEAEDVDNDAATAEAFKAQLLAEMEEQNRRRHPTSTSTSKDKTAPTGPKLGGSRAQREKMRAMEEAKASAGKK